MCFTLHARSPTCSVMSYTLQSLHTIPMSCQWCVTSRWQDSSWDSYKDHITGWVSSEADSRTEISMWVLIRERSWEGSRNGQREKLSCTAVLTTAIAKILSTLAPSWPFRVALS